MAVYGAEDLQHLLDTNKQYVRRVVTRRSILFASSPLAPHLAEPSDVPAEAIQLMKHMTRDWDLWRSHRRVLGTFHLAAKGSKVCLWLQRVAGVACLQLRPNGTVSRCIDNRRLSTGWLPMATFQTVRVLLKWAPSCCIG